MVQRDASVVSEGVSGEFSFIDQNVVSPGAYGVDSEFSHGIQYDLEALAKVKA